VFRPERWLEVADAEKLREMEGTVDLVFGFGKYQCLGRNIAFLELNKAFVEVSFFLDLCGFSQTCPNDISLFHGFGGLTLDILRTACETV
jgi:hypothetical protein